MFPDWRLLSHKISFASLFLGHPICICCVTCMLWYRLASVGLIQSVIEIRHLSVIQTCHLSVIQTCHLSVIQTCQQLVYNRLPSASRTRWPSRQQTMGNEARFLLLWHYCDCMINWLYPFAHVYPDWIYFHKQGRTFIHKKVTAKYWNISQQWFFCRNKLKSKSILLWFNALPA